MAYPSPLGDKGVLASTKQNNRPWLNPSTARSRSEALLRPGRRQITERDRARMIELYESGMSSRAVAAEVGVAKATVLNVLQKAGTEMRRPGWVPLAK